MSTRENCDNVSNSSPNPQGVGWTCGAFSNPENFSTAAAQTFVTGCNKIGMGISFVYPGNAKNSMLETPQDAQYIERAMLVAIYGHGNIFGPDVEYVPTLRLLQFPWHVWGDLGVMRWVFVGGCDALGFPVKPDGMPVLNSDQAPPNRWSGTLGGISGICGYRSASWYVPGFQQMMPLMEYEGISIMQVGSGYAQTLVNNMGALNTFWGSWVQAGNWLHGQLNHLAEAAVFVNHPESLNEHLKNYLWHRQGGLDFASIRRHMVGKGAAPVYHYCDTCDANGRATCTHVADADFVEIHGLPVEGAGNGDESVKLPVYDYVFDDVNLAEVKAMGEVLGADDLARIAAGEVSCGTSSACSFGTYYKGATTDFAIYGLPPVSRSGDVLEALQSVLPEGGRSRKVTLTRTPLVRSDAGDDMTRIVSHTNLTVDGVTYPVLLDNGIDIWQSHGTRTIYASLWRIAATRDNRRVPDLRDVLAIATLGAGTNARRMRVVSNEIAYVKAGTAFRGQLVPTRKVSLTITGDNGRQQNVVVMA